MQDAQKSLAAMEAQQAVGMNDGEQPSNDAIPAACPGVAGARRGTGYWEGWDDDNIPAAPRMFSGMPGQLGQVEEEVQGVLTNQLENCDV